MKKITKKAMFEVVKSNAQSMILPDGVTAEDVIQFAEREIELLSRPSKSTPQQVENESIKARIVEGITGEMTVAEIASLLDKEITSQRLSALLSQLVKAEILRRIEPKGKEKVKFARA